jgi:tetratricopeptide (TPR) repeat protein
LSRLDGLVLEGATDLSAALGKLLQPGFEILPGTPVNVFLLSDGQITWGEPDAGTLAAQFESRSSFAVRFYCYHTGIGADNAELFAALTRRGGGVFNCFSEADIAAAAEAHRNQCFQIEHINLTGPDITDVVVAGRKSAVYPDGELIVAARAGESGPARLVLEGTYLGKPMVQEFPLESTGASELAPRGWAEIAVANLVALNEPNLDSLTVALCQQFGIASRLASFLVLENEEDYKRLNLQEERGKVLAGGTDLGQFIETLWRQLGGLASARESFLRFLARVEPRVQFKNGDPWHRIQRLLDLLKEDDFQLPESKIEGRLVRKADVSSTYLLERERDQTMISVYAAEARRRAEAKDADGAMRVLSSIVEEYPARADALRLVGYRLIDLKQPAQAVRLFQQVQRNRPFEPHSYRDLARSLEESGKFGLAALQYELVLAGTWHNRFRDSLKMVAQEEYARMMHEAVRRKDVGLELKNYFGEQIEKLGLAQPQSDLRVTISWNTDNTDVDLWVIEPDGTKCFYQHQQTRNGGELSQDQTQGYGPERYQARRVIPGVYTVIVHYFRANPNLLGGETHVTVTVTRNAGTPQEATEPHGHSQETRRASGSVQGQVLIRSSFNREPPASADSIPRQDGRARQRLAVKRRRCC